MLLINYESFLEITNVSKPTFKNYTKAQKVKSLEVKGYKVLEIKGRGVNSVFVCEVSDYLQLKLDLEEIIGVSIKHPEVMNKYLSLWLSEKVDISFHSDKKVAEILFNDFNYDLLTLKNYIIQCRKELIQAGMMKPIIKDKRNLFATKRKFVLVDKDTFDETFISSDEAIDSWRDLYYSKIKELEKVAQVSSKDGVVSKEVMDYIRQQASAYMKEQLNGSIYTVFKKEFSLIGFENDK